MITLNKTTRNKTTRYLLGYSLVALLSACGQDHSPNYSNAPQTVSDPTPNLANETAKLPTTDQIPSNISEPAKDVPLSDEFSDEFAQIQRQAATLPENTGQQLYETTCHLCHAQGLLNAPKLDDKQAWQQRLAQGREVLFTHSAKGFNSMPAQANQEISQAQVLLAVDYMIQQVSK